MKFVSLYRFVRIVRCSLLLAFAMALSTICLAQWQTQSIQIQPGWTAVYLHVDASWDTVDDLVGGDFLNPISEIWMWRPPVTSAQFVTSPQAPTTGNTRWLSWVRSGNGAPNSFNKLNANTAYLVRSSATTNYTWRIKGKPNAPIYNWSATGLNLLGFPSVAATPPPFDAFLAPAPAFLSTAEIFNYTGGELSANNPAQLFAYHITSVARGRAYWMRAGSLANNYFGPFQITLSDGVGINFGDASSHANFRLRNVTSSNLTVTLKLVPTETPPSGQAAIAGLPKLLVRGALNATNLTYGYSNVVAGSSMSWTLAPDGQPGSDINVVLGLNRYAMGGTSGDYFAGVLQFTDSLGFTDVDVPVSAVVSTDAGLWVGNANVSQVANYLKTYQRDTHNAPVMTSGGSYVVTGVNTNLANVPQTYPLRLIVHNDGTTPKLLQRVYYGYNPGSNLVVTLSENSLDPNRLASARRITATHLPWTDSNTYWAFNNTLGQGKTLTATTVVPYDDTIANPFLHTYHPDHDNIDATFKNQLPQGAESYQITREITLRIAPPLDDFGGLTTGNEVYYGDYSEKITLAGAAGASRNFTVSGIFTLNHISKIPTLTP